MTIKMDFEILAEEAQKYTSIEDFKKNNPDAYKKAKNKRILHKITGHMDGAKNNWTSGEILDEAQNYKNIKEFEIGCFKAYQAARRKGLIEKINKLFEEQSNQRKKENTLAINQRKSIDDTQNQKDDSYNRDILGSQILSRPLKPDTKVPHWIYIIGVLGGLATGGILSVVVGAAWLFHADSISKVKRQYRKDAELWNSMYPEDKVDPYI